MLVRSTEKFLLMTGFCESPVTPYKLFPLVSRDTYSHHIRARCAGRVPAKISRNVYTVAHEVNKRELPPK